jgi:predicted metalloprotease
MKGPRALVLVRTQTLNGVDGRVAQARSRAPRAPGARPLRRAPPRRRRRRLARVASRHRTRRSGGGGGGSRVGGGGRRGVAAILLLLRLQRGLDRGGLADLFGVVRDGLDREDDDDAVVGRGRSSRKVSLQEEGRDTKTRVAEPPLFRTHRRFWTTLTA